MKKNYVLDSNVLINDPLCIYKFEEHSVTIPLIVLEEIDSFKKEESSRAQSSRLISRELDKLRENGSLHVGVALPNGGLLRVEDSCPEPVFTKTVSKAYNDNVLLQTILNLQNKASASGSIETFILLTKDINLRVRADSLGIPVQDYENMKVEDVSFYEKVKTILLPDEDIDELYSHGAIEATEEMLDNTYFVAKSEFTSKSALGVYRDNTYHNVRSKEKVYELTPKNKEQAFAIDAMMDEDIHIVVLTGAAGVGKTLITLACGLEQVIGKNPIYEKVIVSRPVIPMGKDIGFLPGPQPLDSKIATPNGWTTMGDIKPGDKVMTRSGEPAKVLEIFPQGFKDVYRITTNEGNTVECCGDHLWHTQTWEEKKRGKTGNLRSTNELAQTLHSKNGKLNHYLPRNEAVKFSKKKLPLHPYVLGAFLGNGSLSSSVLFSTPDLSVAKRVDDLIKELGCSLTKVKGDNVHYYVRSSVRNNKPARPVRISCVKTGSRKEYESIGVALLDPQIKLSRSTLAHRLRTRCEIDSLRYEFLEKPKNLRWSNPVKNILDNLHILNKKAWEKSIPDIYKYSSVEDRLEVLRGLMDTDGCIKKNGEASFCTASKRLAEDVIEIVRSLGGRATLLSRSREHVSEHNGRPIKSKRPSYEFTISMPSSLNPFYTKRKADHHSSNYIHQERIESIEYAGKKEVKCILIDNPEHLYLTDNFIVTHNTEREKIDPWLGPIYDSFDYLSRNAVKNMRGKEGLAHLENFGKFEVQVLTYIRGRSIPNSFIILDECFPRDQYIATESGKMTIGSIYDRLTSGQDVPKVVSYNETTKSFELKRVTNAWRKGERDLVKVEAGNRRIRCTPDHLFLTHRGWVPASNLSPGDGLVSHGERHHQTMHRLNSDQKQLVLASILGDGNVESFGLGRGRLRCTHGMNQAGYCGWKAKMMGADTSIKTNNGFSGKDAIVFQSKSFYLEGDIGTNRSTCPEWVLNDLDVRGLAIWAMDYGSVNWSENGLTGATIWTSAFDAETQGRLVSKLKDFGINANVSISKRSSDGREYFYLSLNKANAHILLETIAPYVHPDLDYKLGPYAPEDRYIWDSSFLEGVFLVVDKVTPCSKPKEVFDIEVEDNHNFVVCANTRGKGAQNSGPVVHNCQNLTRHEMKTILTRAGKGTKIILCGDVYQIDNPYLDVYSNGLTYVIDKLRGDRLFAHIHLTKGERSALAELAASKL
jgi:predicted ribonuclease YlaK/intein/homing endonuclease